jgi:hypothetical protein
MRISRQGYEGRADRIRDLRCDPGKRRWPSTALTAIARTDCCLLIVMRWQASRGHVGSFARRFPRLGGNLGRPASRRSSSIFDAVTSAFRDGAMTARPKSRFPMRPGLQVDAACARTMARHAPHRRTPSEDKRHSDQEQIQMIAIAIGIPKPSAPKIAATNSKTRPACCRTPDDDMTLLLGAPRASARPQDERSIAPSD